VQWTIEIGFTTVSGITVTVAKARGAGNSTTAGRASGSTTRSRALGAAGIAIVNIGVEVDFAAVGRIAVAILEACVACAHGASAVAAGGSCVGKRALGAAGIAVVDVGLEVDLAAVGVVRGVAISKARSACAHRASAADATGSGIGERALGAAAAAIVRVIRGIRGASRTRRASCKAGAAGAVSAYAGGAHGGAACRRALGAAGIAVVNIGIQVDLASIGRAGIAIGKPGAAGADGASPIAARRRGVGVRTNRAAAVAMGGICLEIDLAAIGRCSVAVGITGRAGSKGAYAAVTAGGGIREGTHGRAGVAMVGIGRQIDFAAIANRGIAVCKPGIAGSNRAVAASASRSRICWSASLAARAAVLHVGTEVNFTTVRDQCVTIAKTRGACNRTYAVSARGRSTGGVAYIVTSAAVSAIVCKASLAAIGVLGVTVGKSGIAGGNRAGRIEAGRGTVRGNASGTTSAAVGRVVGSRCLAAVAHVAVTVSEASRAGDRANARGTSGRTVSITTRGRVSRGAAASAVGYAARGVGFATIGGTGIAILEVTGAGRYRTDPGYA